MGNSGFAWKVAWLTWAFIMVRVIAALAADASERPGALAPNSDSPSIADRRALEHLLEDSGLKVQLESLSASVRAQFVRSALSDQDRVTIDRIVSNRFDAEALYARITRELAPNVEPAKLAEALAWYNSPLGRRVTALELAAARLERDRGGSPGTERPSSERIALVERLDAGLGASETTVDVTVAVVRSLVQAFQPAIPALANLSGSQLDEQLALARNRMLLLLRPPYIAGMLVAYRSLSDAELAKYVRFVESEAGTWYMSQTNSALLRAVAVAAGATAAELATALPRLAAELR